MTKEKKLLDDVPFFAELTKQERDLCEQHVDVEFFKAGSVLKEKQNMTLRCYIILKGEVEVVKGHGTPGAVKLASLGPGEFFGEMAFLSDSKRGATVVASQDTTTIAFQLGTLHGFEETHPSLALKIYKQFLGKTITRIRHMNEQMERLQKAAGGK